MNADQLAPLLKTTDYVLNQPEGDCSLLLTDSRKLGNAANTLFFAIATKRNSGSHYIGELYSKGVRNFVVPADDPQRDTIAALDGANVWFVDNVVRALQSIAAAKRALFDIPVVGITGSNGKTIVKDWIVQLLGHDRRVVASPKSYNSQIGVPLSVWQLVPECDIAVFEAGISESGEMTALQRVIEPTIGIFTNIGQAHDENFLTRNQKIAEKLQLFTHCETLIYCSDHKDIVGVVAEKELFRHHRLYTWGHGENNEVRLVDLQLEGKNTRLRICHNGQESDITIPFVDRASAENAMHCITLMFYLGYSAAEIANRCHKLTPVAMRLEMNEGVNNCLLVNDSYSLDLNSLAIALDFMQYDNHHYRRTLIMSDILQSGIPEGELYHQVAALMEQRSVSRFVGIGDALWRNRDVFANVEADFYPTVEDFLNRCDLNSFQSETILVKGARSIGFEAIAKALQRKSHETVMEVNLDAMVANLNYYRSLIKSSTKLMAMVKASSYGAGKVEVASTLQYNHADYLTVAYSDEGVELRRNGINLPIMVMNPEEESFADIIRFGLEPDIYSFRILELFADAARLYARGQQLPIHIEFDTGMHRLGFDGADVERLSETLSADGCSLKVKSIFAHLACSEDPAMDDFTRGQIALFDQWSAQLKQALGDEAVMRHILNSSGIVRFPEAQFDMVRLGLGLYGIAPDDETQQHLHPVSRLLTRISQIKTVPAGHSVGYNRRFVAQRDTTIAIIPIGYADGIHRQLGYGRGRVMVGGEMAPLIGSVCMDMSFVDVTGIACAEGDTVEVFGSAEHLKLMAEAAGTIPYELLTAVSPRVKRVYYQES